MRVFLLLLLITKLALALSPDDCSVGKCREGEFLDDSGECLPCPKGKFNDLSSNGCRECSNCTTAGEHERVVRECTSVSDTEVACIPGFFMEGTPGVSFARQCSRCRQCHKGEQILINCTERDNTVCVAISDLPGRHTINETSLTTTDAYVPESNLTNLTGPTTRAFEVNTDNSSTNIVVAVVVSLLSVVVFIIIFIFWYVRRGKTTRRKQKERDGVQAAPDEGANFIGQG